MKLLRAVMWKRGSASRYRSAAVRPRAAVTVRFAVKMLAWVSTAPRGTTSTAAVEMTAKASSGSTSTLGDLLVPYRPAKALKLGPGASPNWYQCRTLVIRVGQSPTTPRVDASTTIMDGVARSTTRSTSWAVRRQLIG